MAVVKNLMVRCGADFSALSTQAKKASGSMTNMQKSVSGACTKMQTAVAGLKGAFAKLGLAVSAAAIIGFAKDAASAYDDQIESEAKLAAVMRNTMDASQEEIQAIYDLTAAQQQLGIVGDEIQLAGAQELATYLEQTDSLKALIPVMNDMVAQQYGYSASAEQAANIATMLGKVMEGQIGGLSRYGYYFDEAQSNILKYGTEAQRVAVLAEIVEGSVGGMNAALAKTPTGRMKQLSNTMSDIKEQFGKAVRTIGTAFLPLLNKIAALLADVATLANKFAQAIANVFGGKAGTSAYEYAGIAADGVEDLADSYDDVADSAKKAGAAQKAALSTADIDTLHILSNKNTSSGGGDDETPEPAGGASPSGIKKLADAQDEVTESAGWLEKALQKIKDLFAELDFEPLRQSWQKLKEALDPLVEKIEKGLGWCWDNILKPLAHWVIEDLAPKSVELLAAAFNALDAILEPLGPIIETLWNKFLKPLCAWLGETLIKAIESLTDLLNDLADVFRGDMGIGEFLGQLSSFQTVLLALTAGGLLSGLESKIMAIAAAFGAAKTAAAQFSAGLGGAAAGAGSSAGLAPALTGSAQASQAAAASASSLGFGWLGMTKLLADDVMDPLNEYSNAILENANDSDALAAILDEINGLIEQETKEYKEATLWQKLFGGAGQDLTKLYELQSQASSQYYTCLEKEGKAIDSTTTSIKNNTKAGNDNITIFGKVKTAAVNAWDGIKNAWNKAGDFFREVGETLNQKLTEAFNTAKEKGKAAWDSIKSAWNSALEFFRTLGSTIREQLSNAFEQAKSKATSAWTNIKNGWNDAKSWASNIGNSIFTGLTSGVEKIIEKFKSMAQQVRSAISEVTSSASGIGSVLSGLQSSASTVIGNIRNSISSAVSSISSLSLSRTGSVPRLATGAVIPPNSEFAAILGDQTHGYNIETPEGLLRQIFREEFASAALIDGMADILAAVKAGHVIKADGREIARTSSRVQGYAMRAGGY